MSISKKAAGLCSKTDLSPLKDLKGVLPMFRYYDYEMGEFKSDNYGIALHTFEDGKRQIHFDTLHEKLILTVTDKDAPTMFIDVAELFDEILAEMFEKKKSK